MPETTTKTYIVKHRTKRQYITGPEFRNGAAAWPWTTRKADAHHFGTYMQADMMAALACGRVESVE